MELVAVIPGTKLPLDKPQRFTYQLPNQSPVELGQVVRIPLGQRSALGIVADTNPRALPKSIKLKVAEPLPWKLSPVYLRLAERLAELYRLSPGLLVKSLFAGAPTKPSAKQVESKSVTTHVPPLTESQQKVAQKIIATLEASGASKRSEQFLIEGVTGSGKTEVYAHVLLKVLTKRQQALLLVPEIAMATHLVERIQRYFGDLAVVWHSALPQKKRHEIWERAARGGPMLVIGPRSALFVPLPKLGCIIIDEEHDGAYKQWDQEPRLHARVVAAELARLANCPLVLGSATPSIETLDQVQRGLIKRERLHERYGGSPLPKIELVDRGATPSTEIFSQATIEALRETLGQKLQALVLINRRGSSPTVLCEQCGHIWRCKQCERPLVWHVAPATHLECHFCQTRAPLPTTCPECGNAAIRLRGFGTQRVEAELRALFRDAQVARLDADISRSQKKLTKVASDLASGAVDILVGTQLVAKSWDIEKLHLVIILNADQGLLTADFRSHERTVQLLWQVAGRAGRRKRQGLVLIETLQPDHPALQAVVSHNYDIFVERELADRKRFGYPPYRHVVTLYKATTTTSAEQTLSEARSLATKLRSRKSAPVEVLPEREHVLPRGKRIVVLTVLTAEPAKVFSQVPMDWSIDLDPETFA